LIRHETAAGNLAHQPRGKLLPQRIGPEHGIGFKVPAEVQVALSFFIRQDKLRRIDAPAVSVPGDE